MHDRDPLATSRRVASIPSSSGIRTSMRMTSESISRDLSDRVDAVAHLTDHVDVGSASIIIPESFKDPSGPDPDG